MSLLNEQSAPTEQSQGQSAPVSGASAPAGASWKDSLPAEFRDEPSIRDFKDVQSLTKSYINAQKMIGGDRIAIPKADDEAAYQALYKKLGLPESIDKYEVKLPEGAQMDEKVLSSLKAEALQAGILPKQFQKLFDKFNGVSQETMQAQQAMKVAEVEKGISSLKSEWGTDWDKNVNSAKAAIKSFGGEEFSPEYLEKSGLGNDPRFIKFMSRVGASLAEDKITGGGKAHEMGLDAEKAQSTIREIQSNPAYMNNQHPDHKALVERSLRMHEFLYGEEK